MLQIFGSRARLMPPTLPKTQLNPITKVHVTPLALEVTSIVKEAYVPATSPQMQLSCKYPLQGPSLRDAMYPPGVLKMRLQGALHPGYSDPDWSGGLLAPAPDGGGGGSLEGGGGAILPPTVVTPPVEQDGGYEVTDIDISDDEVDTPAQVPDGAIDGRAGVTKPIISASVWEQVVGGAGVGISPIPISKPVSDASAAPAVVDGTMADEFGMGPVVADVQPEYTYKDLMGRVAFEVHHGGAQPMNVSILVSVMYKDWELARTTVKALLMPYKSKQYVADFSILGDVTDLWENLSQETVPAVTLDAVVHWQVFRNSVSDTKNVKLTLPSS